MSLIIAVQVIGLGCTRLSTAGGDLSAKATFKIALDTAWGGMKEIT